MGINVELLRTWSFAAPDDKPAGARYVFWPYDPAIYVVLDPDDLPEAGDPIYPLLGLIDPYDDALFGSAQLTTLIAELERWLSVTGSPNIAAALALARRAMPEGAWLAFLGD